MRKRLKRAQRVDFIRSNLLTQVEDGLYLAYFFHVNAGIQRFDILVWYK
jgi:hypothetical protein